MKLNTLHNKNKAIKVDISNKFHLSQQSNQIYNHTAKEKYKLCLYQKDLLVNNINQ